MYCVYCGVKLQPGAAECPLCRTPVMMPEKPETEERKLYSDRLPEKEHRGAVLAVWLLTTVLAGAALACLIFCLHKYREASWAGYVLMGVGLTLPAWRGFCCISASKTAENGFYPSPSR